MQRLLVAIVALQFATGCIDLAALSRHYVPDDASGITDQGITDQGITDQGVADGPAGDLGVQDSAGLDQSMGTDDLQPLDDLVSTPDDLIPAADLTPLQCTVGAPRTITFNGLIDTTMGANIASIGDDHFLIAAVVDGDVKIAEIVLGNSNVAIGSAVFVCGASASCVSPRIARAEAGDLQWNIGVHAGGNSATRLNYADRNTITTTASASCSVGPTPHTTGADAVQAGEISALLANCNDEFQIVPVAGQGLPSIHSGAPVAEVRIARPANSSTKAVVAYTNASVTTAAALNLTTMTMGNLTQPLTGTALLSGLALDVFPTDSPSVLLAGAPAATGRLRIFLAEPTLQTAVEVSLGASSPLITASVNAPVGVAASPDIALVTYQTNSDAVALPITPTGESRRAFVIAAGGKHPQIAWGASGFAAAYLTTGISPTLEVVDITCPPGL